MFLYLDYIRDIIDNFAKFNNSHRKAYFRGKVYQHDNEYNKHFSTTTKNPRILEFILPENMRENENEGVEIELQTETKREREREGWKALIGGGGGGNARVGHGAE